MAVLLFMSGVALCYVEFVMIIRPIMKNGIPKAILYARQSSGDEVDSASISEQLESCRKLAESKGYQVLDEYRDNNVSGTSYPFGSEDFAKSDIEWQKYLKTNDKLSRRPFRVGLGDAFKRLHDVDYLIVYDSTRLMRPLANSFLGNYISQKLIAEGVTLLSCHDGELDYAKFDVKLVQTIREQVESDTKEKLRKRSIAGIHRMIDAGGGFGCFKTLGYDWISKQSVSVNEKEAETIRWIFSRYLETSANRISQELASRGMKGKRGGQWNMQNVVRILTNPNYIGLQYDTKGNLIASKVYKPIIAMECWNKVQDKYSKRKTYGRETTHQHYLSGLIYCAECGRRMLLHNGRWGHWNYICHSGTLAILKKDRKRGCIKAQINETTGESSTPDKLRNIGLAECLLPLTYIIVWQHVLEQRSIANADMKRIELQNELQRLDAKESDLTGVWMKDAITAEAYGAATKTLKDSKNAIREEMASLSTPIIGKLKTITDFSSLRTKIKNRSLSGEELAVLIHKVVARINAAEDWFEVILYDGSKFRLERIHKDSARSCPAWKMDFTVRRAEGQQRHVDVIRYFYKSYYTAKDKSEKMIYQSNALEIWTVGSNSADEI